MVAFEASLDPAVISRDIVVDVEVGGRRKLIRGDVIDNRVVELFLSGLEGGLDSWNSAVAPGTVRVDIRK